MSHARESGGITEMTSGVRQEVRVQSAVSPIRQMKMMGSNSSVRFCGWVEKSGTYIKIVQAFIRRGLLVSREKLRTELNFRFGIF